MKKLVILVVLLLFADVADAQISCPTYSNMYSSISQLAVANLPSCNAGAIGSVFIVTNALLPTVLGTIVGGGSVVTLVHCNGTNWVAG